MKFGEYLLQQQCASWTTEYLQYDRIKKVIRETNDGKVIDQWLQTEYVKIKDFISRQIITIQYQLQFIEQQNTRPSFIPLGQLGDDLVYILYDLHDLVRFLELSLAGFKKLIKSYTKRLIQTSSNHASYDFIIKSLDKYYTPLNQLFVRMAHIKNNRCRETRRSSKMKSLPPIPLEPYYSSTPSRDLDSPLPPLPLNDDDDQDRVAISYYWIHPNRVFELKTLLLIYAKLDQYHPLSTVYLDNNEWNVYNSQLNEQTQSVDSIEFTWAGYYHAHNGNIQVNHLVQQNNDVTSIKRCTLPWTSFTSGLRDLGRTSPLPPTKDKAGNRLSTTSTSTSNGDLAMATALIVEPRNKLDATEQQIDQGLRDKIQQRQWQPTATCTCERTTFIPTTSDNAIEIHIDTNIVMKEADLWFGGQQYGTDGTRHRDTGLSMMTVIQHLKKTSNTIKQQQDNDDYSLGRTTTADTLKQLPNRSPGPKQQEWPEWLKQLADTCDWIHAVPRFSMYVHLVSRLYGDHVPLLPWWLGYFDMFWLDSAISSYGLSRSIDLQPLLHGAAVSSLLTHPTYNKVTTISNKNHMAVNMGNGEEDDEEDDVDLDDGTGNERDIKMLLPKSTTPNIAPRTTTITPSISVPAMTTSAKTAINNMVKKTTNRMTKSRWKATTTTTTGTLKTMKMKVEPKVFFANERTFLSWLQFCALLLTVSLNMINFGGQDDSISRLCGGMFIIITILMALYALVKYEFRAWNLLTRSSRYRFDDVYGPAILCFLLVVAMLINFGLRLNSPPSPDRQPSSE